MFFKRLVQPLWELTPFIFIKSHSVPSKIYNIQILSVQSFIKYFLIFVDQDLVLCAAHT